MSSKVKKVKTPASESEVVSAIKQAWQKIFGQTPSISQVGKAWAQIAIETGNGVAIYNNNVGNMNWTPGFKGDYYETGDSITIGNNPANRRYYTAKMRSYDTLLQGVTDYLFLLKNRKPVMEALQNGSVKDFSYALASVHYYDAHIRDDYVNKDGKKVGGYTSGLSSRYKQFMKRHGNGSENEIDRQPESKSEPHGFIAAFLKQLGSLLDNLTRSAGAISMQTKHGSYNISIDSDSDFASKIEFARILSLALKEELGSNSETFSNDGKVELQCVVVASEIDGLNVVKEFAAITADTFELATRKIGGIKMHTIVSIDTPSGDRLSLKTSETNYRKFQLKFVRK